MTFVPIPMVLFCPACGLQHVDRVEVEPATQSSVDWSRVPHRSHLCKACGHIWRPADVATVGVPLLASSGAGDHEPVLISTRPRVELQALTDQINSPELQDFRTGVMLEALHQRQRWGAQHDAGKAPSDWFWLIGYLAGKALASAMAGDVEKAKHHCISTAAVLANWHAFVSGDHTAMRPGIAPPEGDAAP
jgi:rubredoxin